MALLFVPVLGEAVCKPQYVSPRIKLEWSPCITATFLKRRATKAYYHTLSLAIKHPFKILFSAILLAVAVGFTYSKAGLGAEFFPVDPPFFNVKVRSHGDLSIQEKDDIMRDLERNDVESWRVW